MNIIDKKQSVALLLGMSFMGFVIGSTVSDIDLDPFRPVVLAEKEVRLLEQDLNGKGSWIPEEDMILLLVMVRERLNMIPYSDLYSNPGFVKSEAGKVMVQFVAKRAEQHASSVTHNSIIIRNAGKVESNEFMGLLQKNPLRKGETLYHYFGTNFQQRVKENAMKGRKYSY